MFTRLGPGKVKQDETNKVFQLEVGESEGCRGCAFFDPEISPTSTKECNSIGVACINGEWKIWKEVQ